MGSLSVAQGAQGDPGLIVLSLSGFGRTMGFEELRRAGSDGSCPEDRLGHGIGKN